MLFEPRKQVRPFKYPVFVEFIKNINNTYWLHTELAFNADPQEIIKLSNEEQEIIKRCLLSISTIEVAVKSFWTQLGTHFPVPEVDMLGVTVGESENRHFFSYSHILGLLDIEDRFAECLENPAIKGRFEYLDKYLKLSPHNSDRRKYVIKLILFAILMEHTSLFAQFASVLYFFTKRGIMKDIRNIIQWSAIDEATHFKIGATIVNILRVEYPELFDDEMEEIVRKACLKSIKYEQGILDWIFELGELPDLTKQDLTNFMKKQVNLSLKQMQFKTCFDEVGDTSATNFFYNEVYGDSMDDFFAVRPTDYTIGDISITKDDLF